MKTLQRLYIIQNELWDASHIGISSMSTSQQTYCNTCSPDDNIFNCIIYGQIEKNISISDYSRTPNK